MKKLLILTAALLIGLASSFAQVYKVNVSWTNGTCSGGDITDVFDVYVSIYDDANSKWAEAGVMVTANSSAINIDVPVPAMEDYCDGTYDYTPSFTVYATVKRMDYTTPSPTENCSGSKNVGPRDCHDFYSSSVDVANVILN